MRLLLTNDDGIDAPGLAALEAAARPLGDVLVVAPARRALRLRPPRHHRRALPRNGRAGRAASPSRGRRPIASASALHCLAPEPAWVLSGINAGGNLGADVYHSGTVAAVREAVLHGRPGIALSHYRRRETAFDWQRAARWVRPSARPARPALSRRAASGTSTCRTWTRPHPTPRSSSARSTPSPCRSASAAMATSFTTTATTTAGGASRAPTWTSASAAASP